MNGAATAGSAAACDDLSIEGETTMNTAIHALALAICFTAHMAFAHEMDGVRRALQTIAAAEFDPSSQKAGFAVAIR